MTVPEQKSDWISNLEWAGHHWIIPAAYSCNKGLVLDFCMCTLAEDIREFMKKLGFNPRK